MVNTLDDQVTVDTLSTLVVFNGFGNASHRMFSEKLQDEDELATPGQCPMKVLKVLSKLCKTGRKLPVLKYI